MKKSCGVVVALAAALFVSAWSGAWAQGKVSVSNKGDLKWADAGAPGVQTATVEGDITKGPAHFFLKYPAGLVTPVHHHSADHYVLLVSGNLVLIADGKENKLAPGSYFALTGKMKHAARCEGSEACVMFLDARGPWDVVPEKAAGAK